MMTIKQNMIPEFVGRGNNIIMKSWKREKYKDKQGMEGESETDRQRERERDREREGQKDIE